MCFSMCFSMPKTVVFSMCFSSNSSIVVTDPRVPHITPPRQEWGPEPGSQECKLPGPKPKINRELKTRSKTKVRYKTIQSFFQFKYIPNSDIPDVFWQYLGQTDVMLPRIVFQYFTSSCEQLAILGKVSTYQKCLVSFNNKSVCAKPQPDSPTPNSWSIRETCLVCQRRWPNAVPPNV